jgi:uncharacterized membrane protein (UPF0182 family)
MNFNTGNNADGAPPPPWAVDLAEMRARNMRLMFRIGAVVAALVVIGLVLYVVKDIYTDWLWFDQLGFLDRYQRVLTTRIWLFFAGAIVMAAILAVNLYFAYRFSRGESVLPVPPEIQRMARIALLAGAALVIVVVSIVFGAVLQGRWETFLVFFNRVSFGVEDPQFGRDMGFHVAMMPLLHLVQGWFMGAVIATAVTAAVLYFAVFTTRGVTFVLTPRIRGHLAILGALLMVTIAAAHYLDIFELVFSGRGAAPGAGYTDVNARIPVLWLLVAIALVSAAGFVVSLYYGGLRMMIASFSLWAVLAIVAGGIYPVAFQRFRVNPNEFQREEKFILRAVDATAAAYNLDLIEEKLFPYSPTVTLENVENNPETINNIRLWDHRPLRDTYNQIQTFRQYYNFVGVDVDRYTLPNGEYRQVMLAARELFPENLEEDAQNWVNRKLAYTHGYGVAVSPVDRATEEGRPEFLLSEVPPVGQLSLERPEVYYGENTKDFVIVNSETDEFNYPGPEGEQFYQDYEGIGGVGLGSFFRRAAFAWEFLDLNVLISGQVSSDSRIQYRREIRDRVQTIAPFLELDHDSYPVIGSDNNIWWIQDLYTTTDRYAYSASFDDRFNYIRNSVKAVVDAYDGTVYLFVIDPDDPMIQMYRGAFPEIFRDFDEIDDLDPVLRDHIRYPIDLFRTQAEVNLRYHMRNPEEFFARNDQWAVANEVFFEPETLQQTTQEVEPYYVIMKLPGEEELEFVLLLPFTPGGEERKNLVAWMAARNDGDDYGKLVTFIFPEGQVDGPEQIEGRITSDEEIGRELSLLCPEGKLCIRGNLLAIPLDDSLLYVEPLYIRAQALALPELKKVILADAENVVMSDTLEESLALLLGLKEPVRVVGEQPAPAPGAASQLGTDVEAAAVAIEQLKRDLEALEEAFGRINQAIGDSQ